MESIFSPEPQFQQTQYHKLSDNVNEWEEQIHSFIANVVPTRLGLSTKIHWTKVDDQSGYAVGSIVLSDKSGKSVGVPLIIKQWHLAPIDTVMMDDGAYPLNEDTIKEIFADASIATDTVSRRGMSRLFDSGNMYESTYPPVGGGRYVYSSDASLLQNISDTMWEEDIEDLRKSASPEVLTAAKANGSYAVLSKIAAKKGKKKSKKQKKRSIINVAKKGVNEYSILGNPEGVFDPIMVNADRPTMRRFVANAVGKGEAEVEAVSRIDKNQSYQISGVRSNEIGSVPARKLGEHGDIFLTDVDRVGSASSCDKFGVYGMKDPAGVTSYGYCFPDVINFSGKKVGLKIFSGPSCSAVQPKLSGVYSPEREVSIPETAPDVGKFGTLVYVKDGRALATIPFTVDSIQVYKDIKGIGATDFYGNKTAIIFSPTAQGIVPVKNSKEFGPLGGKNSYLVPSDMFFFELGSLKQMSSEVEDYTKHAALDHDINKVQVLCQNGIYIMKGPDLSKYASVNGVSFDFNSLRAHEVDFLLSSFGCPMDKLAAVRATAQARPDGVRVHGLTLPKVASEVPEDTRIEDYIRSLRCNLVKESSVIDEGEVVDTALSLGFINSENIAKFTAAIPKLKEVLSVLSKLIIASRLGMSAVPEEAAKTARDSILRVVDGLRKLGLAREKMAA